MKIVSINTVDFGSTGNIMLQISALARANGHEAYTYSKLWKTGKKQTEGHAYLGSMLGNMLHRSMGVFLGRNERMSYWSTKKLLRRLKKIQPDVIHLHNLHGWYLHLPSLFKYIKKHQIRVVWTLHDCWALTGHCPHFDMIGCDKWKTGCYDCPQVRCYPETRKDNSKSMYARKKEWFTGIEDLTLVTPSRWLADLTRESFLKEYPVQVIYNGIDLEVFQPTESDFRAKYHLEDKHLILGVSYNWGARKGLDVFLELAKQLPDSYRIILVGTDDKTDELLPKNVISIHRTSNQKELAEIYTAVDVFVNPTREEALGLVNIEALACGTPVVTFRSGGSPECIDETCGVVVEKNDVEAMRKNVEYICEQKPFSKEVCMARAQRFDKRDKFSKYIKLYEQKEL